MSIWQGSAPSNIAMIKYMGKRGVTEDPNQPLNPSLSWTIDHLRTFVEIELRPDLKEDLWQPHPSCTKFPLPSGTQTKFMKHFLFLKSVFEISQQYFVVRSGNNFPSDCGIASSASSYAALTRCAVAAFQDLLRDQGRDPRLHVDGAYLSDLSRRGSGSSCRSFFKGWVEWNGPLVQPIESSVQNMFHVAIVVSENAKKVSSSEAHKRVVTSLLMKGREERATQRFQEFKSELVKTTPSWEKLYTIARAETWDMHALFETSEPSFGYMTLHSIRILNRLRKLWQETGDGPIVTMDAGPNVHLLWRDDQIKQALQLKKRYESQYMFIEDGRLD